MRLLRLPALALWIFAAASCGDEDSPKIKDSRPPTKGPSAPERQDAPPHPLAHLGPWGGEPNPAEAVAVEAIRSRGGHVYVDADDPGRPAVKVAVGRAATDADLVHLAALPRLKRLYISAPGVTDEGLRHLEGLRELETLQLPPATTDLGLRHVRGLAGLSMLTLNHTHVTDAGLDLLLDMPGLQAVYVWRTGVTPKGIEALRQARRGMAVNDHP